MTPADSTRAFQTWLADRSVSLQGLSVPTLVGAVLEFYESVQCAGLSSGQDSDMLLYQWGVYDWGEGEHFEFDLTRQFIEQDDDVMSQLHITAYFEPTAELRCIAPGNQWCGQVAEVDHFRQFIEGSPAYRAVLEQVPQRVAVAWSLV